MANWQGMILTTKGRVLQAKVEAGKTLLSLTKIKLGDGVIVGSQTLEGLTDLVSPKQIIGITTIDPQSSGICKITGTVTNVGLETGYNIKELGLFATDPDDGEILYAVTTDSNFDYLQAEGGATIVSEEFNLSISISNTSQVTATIDATGLLTVSSATLLIGHLIAAHDDSESAHADAFAAHNNDAASHADIRALLKKAGAMPLGTILPFLMKSPPAGWLALDTGALVSRSTYPDLWTWVQSNAPLISETDWQTQAAAQSSVGAYSTGDGSTTFRLPKILDYVRGGLTAEAGTWQGDAFKSHAHNTTSYINTTFTQGSPDYLTSVGHSGNSVALGTTTTGGEETRPKTIKMLYCVKAFDAAVDQGTVEITAMANELLGKVDKTTYAANFTGIIETNGYQKLPSGLILQWGYIAKSANAAVLFPLAFPKICFGINITPDNDYSISGSQYQASSMAINKSTTGFTYKAIAGNNGGSMSVAGFYMAIGK